MCVQCGIGRLKDGVLKSFVEHVHFSIWRYMRSNKRKRRGGGLANIIYDRYNVIFVITLYYTEC